MLRRQHACVYPINMIRMNLHLDMSHPSNKDVAITTQLLISQKYRHPRTRQLAAAARTGWNIPPEYAFRPELLFN